MACTSAENAVEGAQIITSATADKQFATILTDNMVGPGIHINAIGETAPARRNSTGTSCFAPIRSSNIRRRLGSKARSNRWAAAIRSPNSGGLSPGSRRVAGTCVRSLCSIASDSPLRTSGAAICARARGGDGLLRGARHDRRPGRPARPVRHARARALNYSPDLRSQSLFAELAFRSVDLWNGTP